MEISGLVLNFEALTSMAVNMLIKVIVALLVFFIGKWIAEKLVFIAEKIMAKSRLESTVANFLSNLLYGLLLVVVGLAALNQVGFNTTSVVAILGGAAVAVGISLKDQLSNFAAGVIIIVFRPFKVGDYVEISNTVGTIKEINLVHTHLMTVNNHEVVIPNGNITTSQLINYTSLPNRRVDITVGIGYGADIKQAKNILLLLAKNHELVLKDPIPIVRVTNLGDNSVDLTLNVWTTNDDWWSVNCDLLEKIKYALDTDAIEIPFPQRSLHIEGLGDILNSVKTANEKGQITPVDNKLPNEP